MADALISLLIETLGSMAFEKIKEEIGLIKGVDKEIESLKTTLQGIQFVLDDAEKRQLSDPAVRNWMEKLKDASLDIDDLLDEWMTPIALKSKMDQKTQENDEKDVAVKKKVWLSLLSLCICSSGGRVDQVMVRHRVAKEIKELNENLEMIAKAKDRFKLERADHVDGAISGAASSARKETTCFMGKEVCGREEETKALVDKLLSGSGKSKGFGVVSIVGLGGLGKTTLAQLVYNDDRVKSHFDTRTWVCVSDPFDEIKVAREILGDLAGKSIDSDGLNFLVQKIHQIVEGKKFLLVLDDVWNRNPQKWEELEKPLENGAAGSIILVTTRNEEVADLMKVAKSDMIALKDLSDEHCWQIFRREAFFNKTEEECKQLEAIGRKIARKSKGLPLIAKSLGGLMRTKTTINQWNAVLNNEVWELKDPQVEIYKSFLLSYYDLSPSEKRCLLYCSIFPMDYEINVGEVIRMWMSQGLLGCNGNLEAKGDDCFQSLAMHSFFQDFEKNEFDESIKTCKMHDIVCEFVRFMTKDEYSVVEELVDGSVGNKDNALHERTRHLTISADANMETLASLKCNENDNTKLRTLFVAMRYFSDDLSSFILHQTRIRTLIFSSASSAVLLDINKLIHLRYLRISNAMNLENWELPDAICDLYNLQTLDVNSCRCEKLPENIGKLVNLRYLDLSHSFLRTLPDSICNLSKLRTLRLESCSLRQLPKDLGNLVELRHLDFSSCICLDGLPKGIASLTGLQTLNMEFQVNKESESYLDVGDLKALHHVLKLQRYFSIKGCSNIHNASEAREIGVMNMERLAELRLDFGYIKKSEEMEDHEKEILEALKPSPNLKSLVIAFYSGTTMSPKWLLSLINLTILNLHSFCRCSSLPPLGVIPSLKKLNINFFHMVEVVGPEFLGLENLNITSDCITGEKPSFISFPKLEELSFYCMNRWESWILGNTTIVEGNSIVIMPRLFRLNVSYCESLKALPDFLPWPTLKELYICNCKILKPQYESSSGTKRDKIAHIPRVYVR